MNTPISAHDVDATLSSEGLLVLVRTDPNAGEDGVLPVLFPWKQLVMNFVDDLVLELETTTCLAMPFVEAEMEVYGVIDALRDAASNVDQIFEPLLSDEDESLVSEYDLFLADVKGAA